MQLFMPAFSSLIEKNEGLEDVHTRANGNELGHARRPASKSLIDEYLVAVDTKSKT